ncbi:CDP-glucose 4,6-dehydratase [Dyadobacter sp. CY343]|uniref:CDP-glucose 4,6-dehydratase n=1 Tax=Dyadobacter sp. CY343 TaxID=2907299 RepID=UPI001F1C75A2|nr:CDP-glucose 4,6-dehydratase [Dyadobacter sp. CY343]MCE7058639.1 CDP-glucose 4,6-dehydratase [Dyadobacter sp. CY343]
MEFRESSLEKLVIPNMNYKHLSEYYKGKRVFLTGHTGFKGAWMLQWLNILGAEVKGYALAPLNATDLYNCIDGDQLCNSVIADIRDRDRLISEVNSFQPDFIFHLAAQPLVRLSYQIPSETFEVNAIGTANLLDAARALQNACCVVLITTDKVYENNEWHYPYRENDRLGGYDPYSASKACAEIVISSYRNSFFNPAHFSEHKKGIASARAGNVIGGGDWSKDRIIPDVIRALQKDEAIHVRNPFSVRPWQHALEPVAGYLHLGTRLAENPGLYSQSYNFGPFAEDNLTVEELVQQAIQYWGAGSYESKMMTGQPHEAGLLKLDISKAINELGWKPKYNAKKAIAITLEWYKAFSISQSEAAKVTRETILEYAR